MAKSSLSYSRKVWDPKKLRKRGGDREKIHFSLQELYTSPVTPRQPNPPVTPNWAQVTFADPGTDPWTIKSTVSKKGGVEDFRRALDNIVRAQRVRVALMQYLWVRTQRWPAACQTAQPPVA